MAKQKNRSKPSRPGSVRIIAGQWRSRRITVPADADVRPTGDRVRETLFNWLAPTISGARCLDLFAGSGVLSFEALSRGAASATLLEKNPQTVKWLTETAKSFDSAATTIINQDALSWLDTAPRDPFNLVFLDPPFGSDLLPVALDRLVHGWLSSDATVYVESAEYLPDLTIPANLQWTKHARLGNVSIALAANRFSETR
ncbi:MAG: 16S rRNA (guanine(966)-N(2))-methyltransferase RsmD [Gammaproteobacteria bacterium]